jgi:hypothetical protein
MPSGRRLRLAGEILVIVTAQVGEQLAAATDLEPRRLYQ